MHYVLLALILLIPGYGKAQPGGPSAQSTSIQSAGRQTDYVPYYRAVTQADSLLSEQAFKEALATYQTMFRAYPSGFLRDYKISTQLAFHLGQTDSAYALLRTGIRHGWTMRDLKKMPFYPAIRHQSAWKQTKARYVALREEHLKTLRSDVRGQVRRMFRKDQRMALRALLHFTARSQNRYAERKFAPHSVQQLRQLAEIINAHGYPGEKMIGNPYWASVILSHHNSISSAYQQRDTLYPSMRPRLLKAVAAGQLSPPEFARMDDWYVVIKNGPSDKGYGYISPVQTDAERQRADSLRAQVALSGVEAVKKLKEVQKSTGLNFYLP